VQTCAGSVGWVATATEYADPSCPAVGKVKGPSTEMETCSGGLPFMLLDRMSRERASPLTVPPIACVFVTQVTVGEVAPELPTTPEPSVTLHVWESFDG
jgi:hypothetical protein